MGNQLLNELKDRYQKAEEKIKRSKQEIAKLEEEIGLNERVAKNETFREDVPKEDQEALKYETIAFGDIKRWEQSKLGEAQQEKLLLEHKIKFCR